MTNYFLRQTKTLILVFFIAVSAVGCAGVPDKVTTYHIKKPNPVTFDASFDKVWIELTNLLIEQEYEVTSVSKEAGLITTAKRTEPKFTVWPWGNVIIENRHGKNNRIKSVVGNNPALHGGGDIVGLLTYAERENWKSIANYSTSRINYSISVRVRRVEDNRTSVIVTPMMKIPYTHSRENLYLIDDFWIEREGTRGWMKVKSAGNLENSIYQGLAQSIGTPAKGVVRRYDSLYK